MALEEVIGRASFGVFLLRYGNHFPYTSLLIQSLKASHYISLDRNVEDLKVYLPSIYTNICVGIRFGNQAQLIHSFGRGCFDIKSSKSTRIL